MTRYQSLTLEDCSLWKQDLQRRPVWLVHVTAVVAGGMLLAAVLWGAFTQASLVVRAHGRVRPREVATQIYAPQHSRLNGRVEWIACKPGDRVVAGQVLLKLDTRELDEELARTRQALVAVEERLLQISDSSDLVEAERLAADAKARAELAAAEENVARLQRKRISEIADCTAQLRSAQDQLQRFQQLAAAGAGVPAELVAATATYQSAQQRLEQAELPVQESSLAVQRAATALIEREFAVRQNELRAQRNAALAEQEKLSEQIPYLSALRELATIRAPQAGQITQGDLAVGDVVQLGTPVLSLARDGGLCFEAAVSSQDMGLLHEDMQARVRLDAFDYQQYGTAEGRVSFIAADARSEATTSKTSSIATTESSVYLVRINLDKPTLGSDSQAAAIRLGMSGRVDIVTGRHSLLYYFLKRIRSAISL